MNITKDDIADKFRSAIAEEIKKEKTDIDVKADFSTFGVDSVSSIYILEKVERQFKVELNPIDFWDYPTIEKISAHIFDELQRTDGKD